MTKRIAALMVLLASLAGCATSPTGRSQLILISDAELAQMGVQAFDQMRQEVPVSKDPKLRERVRCVVEAITAQVSAPYRWEVEVFDADEVNAFALPGGKIGVFKGLFKAAENQHQLAAVIGHEVAHVMARHAAARVSQQLVTQLGVSVVAAGTGVHPDLIGMGADLLLTLPYSRADESEADILGLTYMARAGFDPRESLALWRNMAREAGPRPVEFLSTHPAPETRMRELERHLPQALALYEEARAAGRTPRCDS
ncbi:MAG: Zn-dependent protease [Porticoccaceae bacterium]|nr:MAG: Zn-dependent protease [Porticoccaceae bacterium]